MYLASRLFVFIGLWLASRMELGVGVVGAVTPWDGGWYLSVAEDGYPRTMPVINGYASQSNLAFFPLYPMTMRGVHSVFGMSYVASGLLVAGVAGLVTAVLLRRLFEQLWGGEVADRGVALFCFFPGALVLSFTYSEALMLALTVGALLALLSRRWFLAGLLAALATATRPNALALAAACAWASFAAIRSNRDWRSLAAPIMAPLGFVAFQAFLWAHTGDAGAWWKTQRQGWGERLTVGAPWDKVSAFVERPLFDVNIMIALVGTLFVLVTTVLLIRARPPAPLAIYTAGVVLLALFSQTLGARPRFLLTAFPLVMVLARWLSASAFTVTVAGSATLLGSFAIVSVVSRLITP